jgi:hypothetical protein
MSLSYDSCLVSAASGATILSGCFGGVMERRQSTRIPFKSLAFVCQGDKSVASEILNISRCGLFIATNRIYDKGGKAFIYICLKGGARLMSMALPCMIARVSHSGIGCASPHLEPETLLFMSNLIHSQGVAPTEFMQSFYSHLDGLEPQGPISAAARLPRALHQ